jgi:DNA-binding transcriptional ArsR family regulator
MEIESTLGTKYETLFQHLDERQRRLVAAADAQGLGWGGTSIVARASGLSRPTIHKALRELNEEPLPAGQVRRAGAGRKRVEDPALLKRLEQLIDPATRGDPMSALRWTSKSTRHLAQALSAEGYDVSHETVSQLLRALGYSLQANAKMLEGNQHPDRNAQFEYINTLSKRFMRADDPVIAVDTKKKELVGPYARGGREWQPKGEPERVLVHDFIDANLGKAIPYGVYDVGQDQGWVNVGIDHDTASFAAQSIRRWWRSMGAPLYPNTRRLLICADGGGSNGYRSRLWKFELQRLATDMDMEITACHLPPGTSKWNKIEHRLFSHITMNWRGRPLVSHDVVVNLIGATRTTSGLKVAARLDKRKYPTGVEVTDAMMESVNLKPHAFHGEWNYTIAPAEV